MSPNEMPRKAAPVRSKVIGWSEDGTHLVRAAAIRPLGKRNRPFAEPVWRDMMNRRVGR